MKDFFKRGLNFVRKNPTSIYSLLLIVIVAAVIFANTYFAISDFQRNTDNLLRQKAALAEDILRIFARDKFSNTGYLQTKLDEIKRADGEIGQISIMLPEGELTKFKVIASTEEAYLNSEVAADMYLIAWNRPQEGLAHISFDEQSNRYWNVVKVLFDEQGQKAGLLTLAVSLAASDAQMQASIQKAYGFALLGIMISLLVVLNHVRLFRYEIKASKLEEVDKMKDDFISMASHELKSPLTAIRGYVELLDDEYKTQRLTLKTKQQQEYLGNITTSVNRLKDLVEDLLEVSRLQQNKVPVNSQKFELNKVLTEILAQVSVMASAKKLQLNNLVSGQWQVFADPERVKQIVVNLLSNAIKYTPAGKVEISLKDDYKHVFLTVADTGLGMSAEDVQKLFGKFYRVKNDQTARIPGTGLGLWISRELAQKMGGDITVESIQGVGSHFTLKLPKADS